MEVIQQYRPPRGIKRHAEDGFVTEQRLSKRLELLDLGEASSPSVVISVSTTM
jgi:hypothetical protein